MRLRHFKLATLLAIFLGFGGPGILGIPASVSGTAGEIDSGTGNFSDILDADRLDRETGMVGCCIRGLAQPSEVLPTPVVEPKFFGLDWYALTDELDWDLSLDGASLLQLQERTSDVSVLLINGKDEIYVVGEAGRSPELVALLQSWDDRVSPFFNGGGEV